MRFWRLHPGLILKRFILATLIASVISCWIFVYQVFNMDVSARQSRKSPNFVTHGCQRPRNVHGGLAKSSYLEELLAKQGNRTLADLERTVLLIVRQASAIFRGEVAEVLEANRIPYQNFFVGDKFPLSSVIDVRIGRFSTIVFECMDFYVSMEAPSRKLIEDYCRKFSVGLVIFTQTEKRDILPHEVPGFGFKIRRGVTDLKNAELNRHSRLLRMARAGGIIKGNLPDTKWSVFFTETASNSLYETVELATRDISLPRFLEHREYKDLEEMYVSKKYTTVLHDLGELDGVQRVYFGSGLQFWLHKLLFLDALALLSRGKLAKSLDRWILVDIDDIFVGKSGVRMTGQDVEALLVAQKSLQMTVPGFRFNLGFSGAFFLDGNDDEDEGDWALIRNANSFWWFSHMWGHMKPHENPALEDLVYDMKMNWEFAKIHGIPINLSYAVAPHHSGVYPTHDALYEAWQRVYQLKATSTEEYPHLKPARKRRGFIYKNIKVLPRQLCGLFTHTILLDKYPKGREQLEGSIFGGRIFQLLVNNPINIFMSHLSNYGNDRLGLYVFQNVMDHAQCWTNLNFRSTHPVLLADKYFQIFPADAEPLWQNPCSDKRHLEIWAEGKTCRRLPSFLVIGPQKTGTTALYTFLTIHPEIVSNEPSVKTYEEIQFFNGHNYARGLDWYMEYFPDLGNGSKVQSFEKSANYFDAEKTTARVHALLPMAKLIVILTDPVKRAYSWYQHIHSHHVQVAVENSFYTVLTKTAANSGSKRLTSLGQRCLVPGLYAYHLERWLSYFPPSQILILDGDKVKNDPVSVMNEVQKFLKVTVIDYSTEIRFDRRKGFYCQLLAQGRTKCLGRSKGRHYPKMDSASKTFLQRYYMAPNKRLADLLNKIKKPHPDWLRREIVRYRKQGHTKAAALSHSTQHLRYG